MDIGQHHIHARLHDAERAGGEDDAFVIEAAHQNPPPLAFAAEHVLFRHLAILEHQFRGVGAPHAELVQLRRGREPREPLFDDEGGDALRPRPGISLGVDHQGIGVGAVGDPHFRAVEDIAVPLPVGAKLHADHVGPGAGLAHGQGAHVVAGNQFRQVAGFLIVGAVELDLVDRQLRVRPVAQPHRGRGAADFLHGHHVLQITHGGAAIGLVGGNPQQAQAAHLGPQVLGEFVAFVDGGGPGGDFLGGETADGIPQHVGRLAEIEVESWKLVWNHYAIHFGPIGPYYEVFSEKSTP